MPTNLEVNASGCVVLSLFCIFFLCVSFKSVLRISEAGGWVGLTGDCCLFAIGAPFLLHLDDGARRSSHVVTLNGGSETYMGWLLVIRIHV